MSRLVKGNIETEVFRYWPRFQNLSDFSQRHATSGVCASLKANSVRMNPQCFIRFLLNDNVNNILVWCPLSPDPSSHYVITLKAFNNVGEGIPVYESAITRPQSGKARIWRQSWSSLFKISVLQEDCICLYVCLFFAMFIVFQTLHICVMLL